MTAILFAVVLVGGSFVLAGGAAPPRSAEASQESALLQAIASRDSDNDGLPDWEEALYGTDPHKADTRGLGMTDGEAVAKGLIVPKAITDASVATSATGVAVSPDLPPVPAEDTLTAAFSKNLFTLYLNTVQQTGGNLSDADLANIANEALTQLGNSIAAAPPFKTARDLKIESAGGPVSLKAFAAAAEAVMAANTADATTSELVDLQNAVENNDASALGHITSIAKAYRASAAGLAALPVPPELATADLAVVNTLASLAAVTNDLAQVNTDSLTTMLALQKYPQAVIALTDAFHAVGQAYQGAGVTLATGEPGASFVNVVADIAASEHPASSPQGSAGQSKP